MGLKKDYKQGKNFAFVFVFLLMFCMKPYQGEAKQMPTSTDVQKMQNLPGNIHVGPLKIHPGVSVTESYSSNIFKEEDHKRGAWITTASLGIILQLPIRRHFLQLDYHADIIEAERFHKQYDTASHFVNGILNLDFNRLTILAGDNWQSNSTPPDNKTISARTIFKTGLFAMSVTGLPTGIR